MQLNVESYWYTNTITELKTHSNAINACHVTYFTETHFPIFSEMRRLKCMIIAYKSQLKFSKTLH